MTSWTLDYTLATLPTVVQRLGPILAERPILTLQGQLGAGKTTLVQGLLRSMGVTELIASPTFTYVNVYRSASGQLIYHFDLYRLPDLNSFLQLGFDEYLLEPNSLVLIEWPEILAPLLATVAERVCAVQLTCQPDQTRRLTVQLGGQNDS